LVHEDRFGIMLLSDIWKHGRVSETSVAPTARNNKDFSKVCETCIVKPPSLGTTIHVPCSLYSLPIETFQITTLVHYVYI
jgi:hypothetical protein